MISVIITILKIAFILGFLVFIHEGGHFLVAKLCKIKVNEFAIGFGPTIWKKQGKETKYALEYFGVEAPQLVSDIYPRVKDIAVKVQKSVKATDNLRTLGMAMKECNLRSIPVDDDENKLIGMASFIVFVFS